MIRVARLVGAELEAALDDLARLRITVFRAFPYLYDGDPDYETRYLRSYRDNERAVLIAALDGDRVVGAASAMPLVDHEDASQLVGQGLPAPETIFYCAESVLLPDYRGQGIGHAFFDQREVAARAQGFSYSLFCSVLRPADHPRRPSGYAPLDPFWRKRGYDPLDDVTMRFHWTDIGDTGETDHVLQCWGRPL